MSDEEHAGPEERPAPPAGRAEDPGTTPLDEAQRLEPLPPVAAGIAHDINTVLAVIDAYASMVDEEVRGAAVDEESRIAVAHRVAQIKAAVERARRLARQLLPSGHEEVAQPRAISLDDVARDSEALLRRLVGDDVEVVMSLAGGLPRVMADPGQIQQLLVDLALNARATMPRGRRITIDTSVLRAGAGADSPRVRSGCSVRLRVSDTGPGIAADAVERALACSATRPPRQAALPALNAVHRLATQAGGSMRVESQPGAGTSVSVLLPCIDAEVEAVLGASRERAQVAPSRGETILVVEDEPAMGEVARRILTRHGYTVLVASGGREAVDIASTHGGAIHLLITDVVMPQMLGREVADRLMATRPSLRVLYMSGYAHAVLTAQGTLQPGATLLEKPFSEDVMLAKVREALGAGSGPRDQTTPVPAAPRRTRVLIVDDQPMIAMTFRRLLERASMEVVGVAATVERGVDLLAEHEPDVVVLDNLLPDGLGLDAVGRMLALAPTTRVVMASGEESDTARDAAIRAGCAGFVDKSAAVARLVPAIREALAPGADVAQGVTSGDLQAGGTH